MPVVATAVLMHLTRTGKDPLKGEFCRCMKIFQEINNSSLIGVFKGAVNICDTPGSNRDEKVWIAAAKKC